VRTIKQLGCLAGSALWIATFSLPAAAQSAPVVIEHGVYTIHLLLHPIGQEEYTVTQPLGAPGATLRSTSSSSDRGMKRLSQVTLQLGPAYAPLELSQRTTTTRGETLAEASFRDGKANLTEAGVHRTMAVPPTAFPGLPAMPAAVEMEMMRYWKKHGEPARLPLLVADPRALPVEIREAGHDVFSTRTFSSPGHMVRLTRYTVANLVFGREILWMDDSNRLAAVMTFAGGLPQEEILDEYEPVSDQLFQSAVQQEMLDLAALDHAVPAESAGSFAIVGARLIDGAGGAPVEHATVVVRNGRIVAAGHVATPPGLRVIHAEGKSVLPGLWEMHSHYSGVEFGPALLAAGVTTARDCGGEFAFLVALRDAIEHGGLGPRLLLAGLIDSGGPLGFGSVDVNTPQQGVSAVDFYANAHFDQIKVYTQIQPEVLRAIAAEAHRRGMTVTGHVPAALTTEAAIEDGQDQINHLQFVTQAMVPPGSKGPVDLNSPVARNFIAFLVAHHTVVDPTIGWGEMAGHPKSMDIASFEPGIRNAPYTLAAKFEALGTPTDETRFRERMANNVAVVGALYRAGVPIVAGSDTGLIGYGLDRELELYVQAGMTPMAAIQSATLVAARAMHREADSGTIEPGKRADMILVNGNPAADIRDLRKVEKVITDGRMYDCHKLHESVGFKP
jgi:imidazolonepropionase-like amidohydrolase